MNEYVNAAMGESGQWKDATSQVPPYSLLHSRPPDRTKALATDDDWRMGWWKKGVQ